MVPDVVDETIDSKESSRHREHRDNCAEVVCCTADFPHADDVLRVLRVSVVSENNRPVTPVDVSLDRSRSRTSVNSPRKQVEFFRTSATQSIDSRKDQLDTMLGRTIKTAIARAPRRTSSSVPYVISIPTFRPSPHPTSQLRHLNTIDRTPRLVEKHQLGSVPSPAERVGEPATEPRKGKLWGSADEAVKDLKSGSVILSAGESPSSFPST